MKLKAIVLLLIIPAFGLAQNFNVDELIKLRKMNKYEINEHLKNSNWQYGGVSDNQHWWKSADDMLSLETAYNVNNNIIHLITMNNGINTRIQNQITRYKMQNTIKKRTEDGILYEIFEGANYVIILMKVYNEYGALVTKTSLMKKETFNNK